ncbi:hypothetical protein [Streptomyces sp. NPDC096934]|uniref:hypothetical protein n=1 Tax=Streptomyces sp. NPDC096934 TaxID=3155551 RepID=UPI003332FF69
MSDEPSEEGSKDWMEIWYETGEITWQKPLSPEAERRIQALFERLTENPDDGGDDAQA